MVKKKQLFYLFYIFLQFYLTSLQVKEYFAKEPELGVFGPLEPEPEPLEKNTRGRNREGKNQEPEPFKKKVRSRSR
jgi:hypothetical protein